MKIKLLTIFLLSALAFISCSEDPVYPKPLSAMKLIFPTKDYSKTVAKCNYTFKSPVYSVVDSTKGMCNLNIDYEGFNASLFLTYIPIDTGLDYHIENARKLVYDHSIKADGIEEKLLLYPNNKVYGTAYKLIGNSASNYQFYVTDSTKHFLRGALYFNCPPNYDSLKPSIEFLMPDFDTLVSSLNWEGNIK